MPAKTRNKQQSVATAHDARRSGEAMPAAFTPADHEARIFARWESAGAFHADPQRVLSGEKPPFCILIPPPNVTGALHLGHALNNTLQDIVARAARMRGFETLWMPGADHAGIATQTVVDKRLRHEGRPALKEYKELEARGENGREQFIEQVQAWKDEYEQRIQRQLKAMGCSCDFDRWRFTMDDICAKAVREAFFRLFKAGLIYRGKRLVNWDPVTQTALADDEVEMREVDGAFYYLRYPLTKPATLPDGERIEHITVATTRPETYLGDTAVAVNPQDPRAAALRGLSVRLPFVGRVIPILEDDYVVMAPEDPEAPGVEAKARFATGFLKVTPAHDQNDWEIGQRHGLDVVNVLAPDATISDEHGWSDTGQAAPWVGLDRFEARKRIVKAFKEAGLLEAVKPMRHTVGHSYRSHAPIEPYLSDQWYVKVTDPRLCGAAQRALAPEQREWLPEGAETNDGIEGDNAMRFVPARYAKMYEAWHEGLRDWCISRQLWWGHRIPVWWAPAAAHKPPSDMQGDASVTIARFSGCLCACSTNIESIKSFERAGWRQDPDVLDTWFSSSLWPLSTMGWPEPDAHKQTRHLLDAFNPTSVLSTAREIITLWVSRMVMANRFFLGQNQDDPERFIPGEHPFDEVYIHAVVQDGAGQRMAKSLGNGVDPLDIVHSHGADALRFTLCELATQTQDVRLPVDIVCPHCSEVFEPATTTTAAGHTVHAPTQTCPKCKGQMATAFGVGAGLAQESDATPIAKNTSARFDIGRKVANKLWNAARLAIGLLEAGGREGADSAAGPREPALVDRWMGDRLFHAVPDITRAIDERRFSDYAQLLYDLLWRDFCDWRLEAVKPTAPGNPAQRALLRAELECILRLAHPVCPFVTEAIWERLRATAPASQSGSAGLSLPDAPLLCQAAWPEAGEALRDERAACAFERVRNLVSAIRAARTQASVPPRARLTLHMPAELLREFEASQGLIQTLAELSAITSQAATDDGAIALTFEASELRLSGGAVAAGAEERKAALVKQIAELNASISRLETRLAKPGYVEKAPKQLVEQTRGELAELIRERDAAKAALERLA